VTGYDDIGFASLSNPSLTTVREPSAEIGAESVRLLRARLNRTDAPTQHRVLRSTLSIRDSTTRA
jgi:LacI family transcriptional regulator